MYSPMTALIVALHQQELLNQAEQRRRVQRVRDERAREKSARRASRVARKSAGRLTESQATSSARPRSKLAATPSAAPLPSGSRSAVSGAARADRIADAALVGSPSCGSTGRATGG
jgi:hypothetical protein